MITVSTDVIVAIITLSGVIFTAIVLLINRRDLSQVNDAVNHRHDKRGPDALKLYDLTFENHQKIDRVLNWMDDFRDTPMASGNRVKEFVDVVERRLESVERWRDHSDNRLNNIAYQLSTFKCPLVGVAGNPAVKSHLAEMPSDLACIAALTPEPESQPEPHVLPGDSNVDE